MLFESVPNFSEGRRPHVIDAIARAAGRAFHLDTDADPDHNRVVVSIAGAADRLTDGLTAAIAAAVEGIDLRVHRGVHPRVGAADVVPIVPLGDTTLGDCRELARQLGRRVWSDLGVPVFFYGHGEAKTLADIRAGRAKPDLGGPDLHPTAGAVCVGARRMLVAFNVILYGTDLVAARALARSIRESSGGLRGVQALAFELPGGHVQLSMNLFRVEETSPANVIAELGRRGASLGAEQVVGLCPAIVASPAADGRVLEARLASAAAGHAAAVCDARGGEEHVRLATSLRREADRLALLSAGQDDLLAAAERATGLLRVLDAAGVDDAEIREMLEVAARGLRAGLSAATEAIYTARLDALDARLA